MQTRRQPLPHCYQQDRPFRLARRAGTWSYLHRFSERLLAALRIT